MRRAKAFAVFVALSLWAAGGSAQTSPQPDPGGTSAPVIEAGEEEKPRRSQHSRSLTKIRRGSIIRSERPEEVMPDLRGEYERRRDHEVIRHFRRLAELDVIAKVAGDSGDALLASEVEAVRRAELERFRLAMQHLRRVIRARLNAGLP